MSRSSSLGLPRVQASLRCNVQAGSLPLLCLYQGISGSNAIFGDLLNTGKKSFDIRVCAQRDWASVKNSAGLVYKRGGTCSSALERCLLPYHLDQAGLSHLIVVLFSVLFLTFIKSINEHWTVDNNENL